MESESEDEWKAKRGGEGMDAGGCSSTSPSLLHGSRHLTLAPSAWT
jgi:hypothetical protein